MSTIQSRTGEGVTSSSIRLPRDLRDSLKINAIKAGRSYNTHVVMILQRAICAEPDVADAPRIDRDHAITKNYQPASADNERDRPGCHPDGL